ncbi:MAG: ribulose-phosphate 3-epimerase [Anaerolineae bacterium]|nr:ribulose-phosphate 3-epimerase [Anaerolineae bacterium]
MSNMSRIQIAPSILAADFTRLGEQISQLDALGIETYHFDVMDGHFVPNISMGIPVLEALRSITKARLDVHLMVSEPERYIQAFANAGADIISIHWEATPNVHRALQMIREAGCKVGLAVNPHTPAFVLRDVITMLDLINVMTVNPGFGGQTFIPSVASKIARLRAMVGDVRQDIDIEADGGVGTETAQSVIQAGANVLVIGTAIFRHPEGLAAGLRAIQQVLASEIV